jgi:hypothetical protein
MSGYGRSADPCETFSVISIPGRLPASLASGAVRVGSLDSQIGARRPVSRYREVAGCSPAGERSGQASGLHQRRADPAMRICSRRSCATLSTVSQYP